MFDGFMWRRAEQVQKSYWTLYQHVWTFLHLAFAFVLVLRFFPSIFFQAFTAVVLSLSLKMYPQVYSGTHRDSIVRDHIKNELTKCRVVPCPTAHTISHSHRDDYHNFSRCFIMSIMADFPTFCKLENRSHQKKTKHIYSFCIKHCPLT